MATVTKPMALDESIKTTESTSRNIADVLAQELSGIASAITGGDGKANKTDIATVEPTNTASRAYSVGELVYVNGNLYKVITAIASGATFTVGTNIQSTNVSGAIKEVASTSNEAIGSTIIRRYGRLRTLSAMGGLVSGITSVTLTSSDRPTNTVTVATQVYANDNTTFVGNGFVKIGASDGSVSLTVNGAATSNTGRCYFTAVWIV